MSQIVIEDCSKKDQTKVVLDCTLEAQGAYALGRNPANHIYLDHPSISRLHAVIFPQDGLWHIHDVGSSKGVLDPQGNRVTTCPLIDGSYVDIGPTRLWFREGGATGARSTPPQGAPKDKGSTSILKCTIEEQDNPWMEGETTKETTHYCLENRRSLTLGSGKACDIVVEHPEIAELELLLFELNDLWRFCSLDGREVQSEEGMELRGKVGSRQECAIGPMKFSIFQANRLG